MRERLQVKRLLLATSLGVTVTMKIITTKKPCFAYFCRLLTCALTLRSLHTYICFWSILWFLQVLYYQLLFFLINSEIIPLYLKFLGKKHGFSASQCTSLLLRSKQVLQNYKHFLNDFKPNGAL